MTIKEKTIHLVVGPTASGKSAKALELAQALDGVIINCDSLQLYDGLPLLTAQPSAADKNAIPHELYGVLRPDQPCSAGDWRAMVEPLINDTLDSERTPIITGGSGLYIQALTRGLSPMPDIPPEIRNETIALQQEMGTLPFYEALKKRDPIMAARFHPHQGARLARAWEVLEATGKSLATWQEEARDAPPEHWNFETHLIIPERSILHQRCNDRFLHMLDMGALDEVEKFAARIENGEFQAPVALEKALGFKYLRSSLNKEISLDEAIEKSQTQTRRYAKRQITWFRNQL